MKGLILWMSILRGIAAIDDKLAYPMYEIWFNGSSLSEEEAVLWALEPQMEKVMLKNQSYICEITEPEHSEIDYEAEVQTTAEDAFNLLEPLTGICLHTRQGWWIYSYCHKQHIRQFHKPFSNREDPFEMEFILGQRKDRASVEIARDMPYLLVNYDEGTECDLTGLPREVNVEFRCNEGIQMSTITSVKEMSTCRYSMTIDTPLLCSDAGMNQHLNREKGIIQCHKVQPGGLESDNEPSDSEDTRESAGEEPVANGFNDMKLMLGDGKSLEDITALEQDGVMGRHIGSRIRDLYEKFKAGIANGDGMYDAAIDAASGVIFAAYEISVDESHMLYVKLWRAQDQNIYWDLAESEKEAQLLALKALGLSSTRIQEDLAAVYDFVAAQKAQTEGHRKPLTNLDDLRARNVRHRDADEYAKHEDDAKETESVQKSTEDDRNVAADDVSAPQEGDVTNKEGDKEVDDYGLEEEVAETSSSDEEGSLNDYEENENNGAVGHDEL
ncbi:hypothetical protein CANCADRAFT_73584 [Tortispora caseinolytica NRRL Y-17796]|uniref:Endoplasmic reticulum lectin n=1 Tax=Tortispora caseinolytica NRRL Y-17796 TaxID=767744 RepID=A0A1E4TIM5_9ASCO|nr:hypothetical protein CANCADRAFT_73584 [Tortispora caseinolytica NRRL Y-17796]